jgi:hypothetical protein
MDGWMIYIQFACDDVRLRIYAHNDLFGMQVGSVLILMVQHIQQHKQHVLFCSLSLLVSTRGF